MKTTGAINCASLFRKYLCLFCRYSGSENEEEEPQVAGEPSSIVQAPGGDTLRRNFQQIQEGKTLSQNVEPPPRFSYSMYRFFVLIT